MEFDNNNQPLVSIITPCYNGERFLKRYLNSVLAQTYDNIEFILINDGSTDQSEKIALSYTEKFKTKGYYYKYIKQDMNRGISAAINRGLEVLTGKYFVWADCDDILDENNIKYKVYYLENHKEKAIVAAKANIVHESNVNKTLRYVYNKFDYGWFDDLIFTNNCTNACGIYMIKTEKFFGIYRNKRIFDSREGQNWQLILPMAYFYSYGNIPDVLYTIVQHDDSHSRQKLSIDKLMDRCNGFIKILENIAQYFDDEDRKVFLEKVYKYYTKEKFIFSIQYRNLEIAENCYKELKQRKICTFKDSLKYWRFKLKMFLT